MRILLIQPPSGEKMIPGDKVFALEPLALEYIGAGVADKHRVRLLDMRFERDLPGVLGEFQPEVVGITGYTYHVNTIINTLREIKKLNPSTKTVVGGHHAFMAPDDFRDPAVDVVVMGEGVATFQELIAVFETGADLSRVNGIAWMKNGMFQFTEPREHPDLDSIPFPDRSLTAHIRNCYSLDFIRSFQPIASLRTSKGCPFRCKFCCCWKTTGGKYLTRDIRRVVAELQTIQEPYIFLADDESFIDSARMNQLADLILASGIKKRFISYIRSDTVLRSPELLVKWKQVGLECAMIGMESSQDKMLNQFTKDSSTDTHRQALLKLKELGITALATFIVRPDFIQKDFDDLSVFIKSIGVDVPVLTILTPLPGTDLYEEYREKLVTKNFDLYDCAHVVLPTTLPLKTFYREFANLQLQLAAHNKDLAGSLTGSNLSSHLELYRKLKDLPSHHQ